MKTLYRSDKLHVYIDDSDECFPYLTIETGTRCCTGTGISFSFAELRREMAEAENFNYDNTGIDSTKTDCLIMRGETRNDQ